jgi:orotidine-5'-phosphate decarboxylase
MLLAAKKTINKHTKLLAITQLTSTDQIMLQKELLINKPLNQVVSHYAKLAASAKIDGVVCAVNEVQIVKKITKQNFITVCPGIRESITNHDQKRVASIAQAQKSGANYVVIGRPITTAVDPLNAYLAFKKQF